MTLSLPHRSMGISPATDHVPVHASTQCSPGPGTMSFSHLLDHKLPGAGVGAGLVPWSHLWCVLAGLAAVTWD